MRAASKPTKSSEVSEHLNSITVAFGPYLTASQPHIAQLRPTTHLRQEPDGLLLHHVHHTVHSSRIGKRIWRRRSCLSFSRRRRFEVETGGVGGGEVSLEGDKRRGRKVGAVGAKDASTCERSSGSKWKLVSEREARGESDKAHCSRTAFIGCFFGGELSRIVT